MSKLILGLDLGPNSIGWALVSDDPDNPAESKLVDLGVRVFPEGVDNFDTSKETSRNESRRIARGMRRQIRRRARRRRQLKKRSPLSGFGQQMRPPNQSCTTLIRMTLEARSHGANGAA